MALLTPLSEGELQGLDHRRVRVFAVHPDDLVCKKHKYAVQSQVTGKNSVVQSTALESLLHRRPWTLCPRAHRPAPDFSYLANNTGCLRALGHRA